MTYGLNKHQWGPLNSLWVEPEVRDSVVRYVEDKRSRTGLKLEEILKMIGITKGKYYDWFMRREVEGKFGWCKNFYELSRISASLKETSLSWIMAIFISMNLITLKEQKLFIFLLIKKYLGNQVANGFALLYK